MSPEIISMEGQVGVGYRTRALEDIKGVAVHYTVTGLTASTYSMTEREKQHIAIINAYHSTPPRAWGGIGYHYVLFDDGCIYGMGSLRCQRAAVAGLPGETNPPNRYLVHMAFVTKGIPSEAARESGTWLIRHIEGKLNKQLVVKGHRQWARPEFPTDCPGEQWESWLPAMIRAAYSEEGDMATAIPDYETYRKGLVAEKRHFERVKDEGEYVEYLHRMLDIVWPIGSGYGHLDHDVVWAHVSVACDQLIAAAEVLKKRATDRGF